MDIVLIGLVGNQLCESLYTEVLRLFESGKSLSHVRKKACLALSRIMQQLPELIEKEQIIERLAAYVLILFKP